MSDMGVGVLAGVKVNIFLTAVMDVLEVIMSASIEESVLFS